ncbi:response regulator transcription factor [Nakamurella sp. UYEF19]|uniref:response regulator transcription factor n=1 Tax=Nakamurella sp. UYEF19 TaxID=1756392 RepID=UPI0033946244
MNRVLIVDAELSVTEPLSYLLEQAGFQVALADSGQGAEASITGAGADLVLLDLELPRGNGFDVCRRLRSLGAVPIIIVTARDSESDKVSALELGADDYVVKPFSSRELIARIGAVLRRYDLQDEDRPDSVLTVGTVRIDVDRHRVSVDGVAITLRLKEFTVLELLMRNRGHVVSRGQLIERIWGDDFDGDPKRADAIINRLRRRLEPDPGEPRHLLTVRGLGYRFES